MVLMENGDVFSFGWNAYGQLGIGGNISENQNIFSQTQMIVSQQNRLIHKLKLQIAKQNEKENEYNNCKKKLQQTEEYVKALINKHNQTVYELNQQILKLKEDHSRHIQQVQNKYETQTNDSRLSSSFSFASPSCSVSSSPSCAVSKKKILLLKQNTMPISEVNTINCPRSHVPKYKSLNNIDCKQSCFIANVNNIVDSYPSFTSNSKITIIQPRLSKSSSRRNSLQTENFQYPNKNKGDSTNNANNDDRKCNTNIDTKNNDGNYNDSNNINKKPIKLRKTKSEIMQNNFYHSWKNDNEDKLGKKRNRYSTPIHKTKSLSFGDYEGFKNVMRNKLQMNKQQVATVNIYDESRNNCYSRTNNIDLEKKLDKIEEDFMEPMSQNSDVSY